MMPTAMKRTILHIVVALAAAAVAAGALAHSTPEGMLRMKQYMQTGVPAPYGGLKNPLQPSAAIVARGRAVYDEHCARCHGATGLGDGPDLKELKLPPADLVHMLDMLPMNDDFFLWAVSEGGVPFGSQMPAFKDVLARDDIWRVIAFMRAGFPR